MADSEWEYSVNSGIPMRRRLDQATPGPWERVTTSAEAVAAYPYTGVGTLDYEADLKREAFDAGRASRDGDVQAAENRGYSKGYREANREWQTASDGRGLV